MKLVDSLTQPNSKVLNIGLSVFDLMILDSLNLGGKKIDYNVAVPNLKFGKANIYKNVKLISLDICHNVDEDSPFKGVFDFVIFSGVLEHLLCDDEAVLQVLHYILKKDGLLFLAVPNAASFVNRVKLLKGGNIHWTKSEILGGTEFGGYGHIREYTLKELKELGKEYLTPVKFYSINDYVIKGINLGHFNRIIPVSLSIDIGVLYNNKP
ncbi:MAG: methyltransferase domain-containing protein [Thermoplasmatales archaeon]